MMEEGKPWQWPGQWVRQESFWRDVGTRTLSAVFAAGLVYVIAVILGYVRRPGVWQIIAAGSGGLAVVLIAIIVFRRSLFLGRHGLRGYSSRPNRSRRPALYLIAALIGSLTVSVLSSIQADQ
jgi:hypothetical protein